MVVRLTAMLALAGAILGFFVSLITPHGYLATTSLRCVRAAGSSQDEYRADAARQTEVLANRLFTSEALVPVLVREANLKEMLTYYSESELLELVRAGGRVRPAEFSDGARGFAVTYEDDNPDRAFSIDRELALTAARMDGKVEIVGTPHTEPIGATAPLCTMIGFGAGLLAGLVAGAFYRPV